MTIDGILQRPRFPSLNMRIWSAAAFLGIANSPNAQLLQVAIVDAIGSLR